MALGQNFPVSDYYQGHVLDAETISRIGCWWTAILLIEDPETGKKGKVLDKYIYHLGMCTFCNLCVLACPTEAIKMNHDFETAVYDRSELTKILNKPGSRVMKDIKDHK